MRLLDKNVVITGAGIDFGRLLALRLAQEGAQVFLSSRNRSAVEATRAAIMARGHDQVHAFSCDLTDPLSIRDFAAGVAERVGHVDVLINNGAGWLEGFDVDSAQDDDIVATVASGGAGTVLMVKHFLPLLERSEGADIVTIVSAAAQPNFYACPGHPAFYAEKGAQAAFTDVLSRRLRGKNIRVISLFPPDFDNEDPFSPDPGPRRREAEGVMSATALADCALFAVTQPRDCFIKAIHFEPAAAVL